MLPTFDNGTGRALSLLCDLRICFTVSSFADDGLSTQLWLVTEYQANGSVYDFLAEKTVDVVGMVRMVDGIVRGLAFLHGEIVGVKSEST